MDPLVLPHGFKSFSPNSHTTVCMTTNTHIEYILTKTIAIDKSIVFDMCFKTDHFGSLIFA